MGQLPKFNTENEDLMALKSDILPTPQCTLKVRKFQEEIVAL
jgi:hypothetical protein